MRGLVWILITSGTLGVLAFPRAEAHGGGGVAGGRLAAPSIHGGPVAHGVHNRIVHRPRLAGHRFVNHPLRLRQSARAFPMTIPWWGSVWPGDWSSAYSYQPAQQVEATPEPPQVIVIGGDSEKRVTAPSEQTLDYSYAQGCQAIPNGYHCDVPGPGAAP